MGARYPEDSGQATGPKLNDPGVRFPPPLVYLAAVLIGAAIDWVIPIRVLPASLIGWLGGALVLLALTLTGLGSLERIKAKTTFRTDRPVSALITTGPYRYSRNPLYLALSILQLGVGIWLNNVWVVVLLVPVIAWIRWRVIAPEERYLIGKFGQVYLDYQTQVRRWF
jgi:protein-S-isoprenylcysteine O-methyltransferase Ste14